MKYLLLLLAFIPTYCVGQNLGVGLSYGRYLGSGVDDTHNQLVGVYLHNIGAGIGVYASGWGLTYKAPESEYGHGYSADSVFFWQTEDQVGAKVRTFGINFDIYSRVYGGLGLSTNSIYTLKTTRHLATFTGLPDQEYRSYQVSVSKRLGLDAYLAVRMTDFEYVSVNLLFGYNKFNGIYVSGMLTAYL